LPSGPRASFRNLPSVYQDCTWDAERGRSPATTHHRGSKELSPAEKFNPLGAAMDDGEPTWLLKLPSTPSFGSFSRQWLAGSRWAALLRHVTATPRRGNRRAISRSSATEIA